MSGFWPVISSCNRKPSCRALFTCVCGLQLLVHAAFSY
jgi:hypothetical protein